MHVGVRVCIEGRPLAGVARSGCKDLPKHRPPFENKTLRGIDGHFLVGKKACFRDEGLSCLVVAAFAEVIPEINV